MPTTGQTDGGWWSPGCRVLLTVCLARPAGFSSGGKRLVFGAVPPQPLFLTPVVLPPRARPYSRSRRANGRQR